MSPRHPRNNFLGVNHESVGAAESRKERFWSVKNDTGGGAASVLFDYEFCAAGEENQLESPRELRRLLTLRRWSYEQEIKPFFPRGT